MLTSLLLTLATATVALAALCGYHYGRTRRPHGDNYLAGRTAGWRDRGRHEEAARTALRRQLEEVTADRDRLDAALDKVARGTAARVARKAVAVYNHQEAGL